MLPDAQYQIFDSAIEAYAGSIYRVAYRMTGNHESANDLVQETFLGAWRNIQQLSDLNKVRGWLFGILRNQYSKHLARQRRSPTSVNDLLEQIPAAEINSVLRDEIQEALEKLDDDQKVPILLVSMEGWSVDEAAEFLAIPRGTVLSRLHRGREKLRQLLQRDYPEGSLTARLDQ